MHDGLLLAKQTPDGSFEWTENIDINRRLREGDATLGWDGDPSLTCVMNLTYEQDGKRVGRVEVWQRFGENDARIILSRVGTRVPSDALIRKLVEHDTHHVDVRAAVDAHNEKLEADRWNEFSDYVEDGADKLAWALGKDLGEPAQDGRPFRPGAAL